MRREFAQRIKARVAQRAGYRCSAPSCRRLTIGPGAKADEVVLSGVASHIYSASLGGPRGQAGQSESEIASIANAIWLCDTHARLIDGNRGDAYPPSLLISYKDLHEAWIRREQGGTTTPFGWLQQLTVCESPLFAAPATLRLGKLTVLAGGNGTGKTALCEHVGGAADARYLQRWARSEAVRYDLEYFAPERHSVSIRLVDGVVTWSRDGVSALYQPAPFNVVLVSSNIHRDSTDSDLQYVSRLLGWDQLMTRSVLSIVTDYGTGVVRGIDCDEQGEITAAIGERDWFPFNVQAGSSQLKLAIEIAIAAARSRARFAHTVLMIDHMGALDASGWQHYLSSLNDGDMPFQTVIATPTLWDELAWDGWERVILEGRAPSVTIRHL